MSLWCQNCDHLRDEIAQLQAELNSANHDYAELIKERADYVAENKRLTDKHGICEWTYNGTDDDFWDTTCGESPCFMEGGIKDNRVVFCHHCGRLVKEIIEGD